MIFYGFDLNIFKKVVTIRIIIYTAAAITAAGEVRKRFRLLNC